METFEGLGASRFAAGLIKASRSMLCRQTAVMFYRTSAVEYLFANIRESLMDVLAVYDTQEQIESKFTPDLLAQVLLENIPKSDSWISVPEVDDPTGANWTPQWTDISGALAEVERFLASEDAQRMAVDGFTADELVDELRLFCNELKAASRHTSKFHLSVY